MKLLKRITRTVGKVASFAGKLGVPGASSVGSTLIDVSKGKRKISNVSAIGAASRALTVSPSGASNTTSFRGSAIGNPNDATNQQANKVSPVVIIIGIIAGIFIIFKLIK